MAALDTFRPSTPATSFGRTVHRILGAVAAWNDARVTRNSLSRLSDGELADIGMVRGDIDALASRRV